LESDNQDDGDEDRCFVTTAAAAAAAMGGAFLILFSNWGFLLTSSAGPHLGR
jgi:hypothetical protein